VANAKKTNPGTSDVKAVSQTKRTIRPPRILTYVDAIARHGSIRKASEVLHIASSALNRRILDLEKELGTDLFERLPRGVRLTAAGELFIGYVRRSLADLDLVGSQIEHLRGLVRGQVRIAAAESMADVLPHAIMQFHAKHPGVQFHVRIDSPAELVAALIDDSVDVIIGHELAEHREISVIFSLDNPLCAVVEKGHPLAGRRSLRLRDCLAYPVALADHTLAGRNLIDRVLANASFHFEPELLSNSIEVMKTYTRLSQAVSFQFRAGTSCSKPIDGTVAIPLSDAELAHAQLVVAVRRGRVLPVAAATFLESLKLVASAL
jgi:DNA-binding transcriptional LysR family regulator